MLGDLTKDDWMAMLEIPAERVPDVVILRGTRNLRQQRDLHAERFSDVLHLGTANGLFEDVLLARHRSLNIGYASVYGDSMAAEIAHLFAVLGTRLIIQTGSCIGLQPSMQAGDLIIPARAIPGEGAPRYQIAPYTRLNTSPKILRRTASLVKSCLPYHTGTLFTTSELLAERTEDFKAWRDAGYVAVDLEAGTTYAVAEAFQLQRLAVLSVFDTPLTRDLVIETDDDQLSPQARGEAAMIDVVTRVLDHLDRYGLEE